MTARHKPIIDQWYRHLDKGGRFYVTAVDEAAGTVELQHFDGDVEEFDLDDWSRLHVEPVEQPEDWTGPVDDIERDDLGYTDTGMAGEPWLEPPGEVADERKPGTAEAAEADEDEERR